MKTIKFSITKILTSLISIYQKHISPYKGFSCAHRVYHQSESCSQYVKRTLIENDLSTAIKLTKQRFCDCADASQKLQTLREEGFSQKPSSNLPHFLSRREFLLFSLPMFFTFGFITPAFASRYRGNRSAKCCFEGAEDLFDKGYELDMQDGECGQLNQLYCLGCAAVVIGSIFLGSTSDPDNNS